MAISEREMLEDWLKSEIGKTTIAAIGGFLLATVLSFGKDYFGNRGKNLATKHDMESLQRQLKENTDITKRVEQSYSREDVLWQAELNYRERQLSELYGPAYGIIKSEKEIFDLWIASKMGDANLQVKQLFHDHNNRIIELIINKAHLIEGASMPDCFVRFVTNSIVFGFYAVPTDAGEIPEELGKDPRVQYPFDFNDHVIQTTEKLKARIESLHQKYAQPLT
jgi:hypothetical protein